MSYTLEDCLNELKLLLKSLRDLAEGKTIKVSYFVGWKWIYLEKKIEMNDISIHPLDSVDNPGLHTSRIAHLENNKLLGAIAHIKAPIKLVGPGKEGFSMSVLDNEEVLRLHKKINLSLFFSMNKTEGIVQEFVSSGFALDSPRNFASNTVTFRGFHILENNNFYLFSSWLEKIDDSTYKNFQIAFDRLFFILTKRRDPIDAIIDGVITWESLFGDRGETTLKVCGSISKFLDPKNEKGLYEELAKVYKARSKIVHGGESNPFGNPTKARETKKNVCDITRNCLAKLIDDPELKNMKPVDRYKKILLNIDPKKNI